MVSPAFALKLYRNEKGVEPFTKWLNALRDVAGRQRIYARVGRLEAGNFGDCKSVGGGVWELRLFFGPGYRVYFAKEGTEVILLLCGGDKKTQKHDIAEAKTYWKEYQA